MSNVLKHHNPVSLSFFLDRSVCVWRNICKIQAVFKYVSSFIFCRAFFGLLCPYVQGQAGSARHVWTAWALLGLLCTCMPLLPGVCLPQPQLQPQVSRVQLLASSCSPALKTSFPLTMPLGLGVVHCSRKSVPLQPQQKSCQSSWLSPSWQNLYMTSWDDGG